MKTSIAITMIIVGAILIFGPAVADHMARAQVVTVMTEKNTTSVKLDPPPMSDLYRFGCWIAGISMMGAAVHMSRSRVRSSKDE